ncbi:AIR synthase family protein [Verrucomicrobiota bacterium]
MKPMEPGKLKHHVLEKLLSGLSRPRDPRVIVGPRLGEDAAVVRLGKQCLVIATDPVTFAVDRIGWYAVQINANDVAAMGARPAWFQMCVLLPAGRKVRTRHVFADADAACRELGVAVTGGHTEVTAGIENLIVIGTMIGTVKADRLIASSGLRKGDDLVMTGFAATEATAILAREFADKMKGKVPRRVKRRAEKFLFDPGISIVKPALLAGECGATAMHDPTEGGVITGLWELAQASGKRIVVDESAIPVREETLRICRCFGIDPLRAIASGSLLIGIPASKTAALLKKLARRHIPAFKIGGCVSGPGEVRTTAGKRLKPQARDEIARCVSVVSGK